MSGLALFEAAGSGTLGNVCRRRYPMRMARFPKLALGVSVAVRTSSRRTSPSNSPRENLCTQDTLAMARETRTAPSRVSQA